MIGATEAIILLAIIAIFFFGKDKVIEWARSVGEAKNAYHETTNSKPKKKSKAK